MFAFIFHLCPKKNRRNFVMRPSKQRAYVPRTVAQRYNPCLMSEVHYTRFPCMRCSLLLIWTSSPQLQSSKMPRVLWLIISMRMSARVREQIARRKLSFSDHSLFVLRVAYYKPNFSWLLGLKWTQPSRRLVQAVRAWYFFLPSFFFHARSFVVLFFNFTFPSFSFQVSS